MGPAADAMERSPDQPSGGCQAPGGVETAPRTIAEVVNLINSLPKPTTLACFVESLARPLVLHAVNSAFSAQPAEDARSPRVFIFFPRLTLSVVPAGPAAHLLELGEARPDDQSVKAELEFPVEVELDASAPYARLPFNESISTCGLCHQGEAEDADIGLPWALASPALRPLPYQNVPLPMLQAEADVCDPNAERTRCALLHALFPDANESVQGEFPDTYATFF